MLGVAVAIPVEVLSAPEAHKVDGVRGEALAQASLAGCASERNGNSKKHNTLITALQLARVNTELFIADFVVLVFPILCPPKQTHLPYTYYRKNTTFKKKTPYTIEILRALLAAFTLTIEYFYSHYKTWKLGLYILLKFDA